MLSSLASLECRLVYLFGASLPTLCRKSGRQTGGCLFVL